MPDCLQETPVRRRLKHDLTAVAVMDDADDEGEHHLHHPSLPQPSNRASSADELGYLEDSLAFPPKTSSVSEV